MDYKADLQIDIYNLEKEWMEQPIKFMDYAELSAQAKLECDRSKEAMEVIGAKISNVLRGPGDTGKKLTESAISDRVSVDDDYRNAVEKYNKAKFNQQILSAAVAAFEQRKSALENLVKLHGQSYYSQPTNNEAVDKINESLNKHKK